MNYRKETVTYGAVLSGLQITESWYRVETGCTGGYQYSIAKPLEQTLF
ncbi:MAG: hypothetical protein J6K48_02640 [Lachnospiraceae bacterium]|nr:hypothetical protein [Lachnospiraceae bacterium]